MLDALDDPQTSGGFAYCGARGGMWMSLRVVCVPRGALPPSSVAFARRSRAVLPSTLSVSAFVYLTVYRSRTVLSKGKNYAYEN